MSISIDDLVSSLSSNHIGQEALDLAALQAQLAQTLWSQSFSSASGHTRRGSMYAEPCTTPTARTPSSTSTFNWPPMNDSSHHSRHSSASRWNPEEFGSSSMDDTDEEERKMVEDLLLPSSQHKSSVHKAHATAESPSSLFTSTDPFYIAQAQAQATQNSSPPSIFSQAGRPAQQSPFLLQQQQYAYQQQQQQQQQMNYPLQYREPHGYSPNPLSFDTSHSLFMATSAAFER